MAIPFPGVASDVMTMTALNVFEMTRLRPVPRCERCSTTAWAMTPGGARCQAHTMEELEEAIASHRADWIPRRFRRRRF